MRKSLFCLLLLLAPLVLRAETLENLPYYGAETMAKGDDYFRAQCRLDLKLPAEKKEGFATLIWFHGGGLTGGSREFAPVPNDQIALVSASYRLAPQAQLPHFLEDAAAAVAWTIKNIEKHGGDPDKVFVAGHSAGGYLAAMIGMDPRWLRPHRLRPQDLAGLIPVSAQVTTHFKVKALRGERRSGLIPVIDEYAPLYHVGKDLPPICLITGERKIEYKSRVEENEFLAITLKNLGHPLTEFHEVPGEDHGGIGAHSGPQIAAFIERVLSKAGAGK
ncbi:MAG: alpha/beta hydrolase [Verrucomicrobiales bacterium]